MGGRDHRHLPHPQLLHRGAYRPRQVHAGRSPARGHAHGRGSRHACAVPGQDGPRARARHHDQGSVGATAERRLRAEPDRYPGARGLHVRGLAVARGVRGGGAAGRRCAGPRGADPRELPPRARRRPRDRARLEQDRPARGRAGPAREGARRPARLRRVRHPAREREVGGGRPRAAAGRDRPRAAPGGGPGGAAAGADLRLDVRPVPRGDHLRPDQGGAAAQPGADQDVRDARGVRGRGDRRERAGAHAGRFPRPGRGRLPRDGSEGRAPRQGRRHDHARRQARRHRAAPRLPRAQADGVVGPVPGGGRRLLRPARGARPAEALRRRPALRAGDPRWRSGSGSGAGSWGCCTWTS